MHWHYSKRMPLGRLVKVGVWERGDFIGVVIFGRGASSDLGTPYGLKINEICELVRVALAEHETTVSRVVALAMRMLKKSNPGLRLVVSFADPDKGHHGGIYQAGGWVYTGRTGTDTLYLYNGRWVHSRSFRTGNGRGGAFSTHGALARVDKSTLQSRVPPPKFRYLMPLDHAMRKQIVSLAKPYPKRVHQGDDHAFPV